MEISGRDEAFIRVWLSIHYLPLLGRIFFDRPRHQIAILPTMHITVFGANGQVGQLVVARLLGDGHSVTALIHHHSSLPADPELTLLAGDIHESQDIADALRGSQAVISCLGSWHTKEKNILSSAMERLIPAMRQAGIRRIISLTGAAALAPHDQPTLWDTAQHALLNAVAPKILRDGEDHIGLLAESGLDWTVIRSPIMNETGTRTYQLHNRPPQPWHTIHRQAVANCLVDLLANASQVNKAPFISRT